MTIKSESKIKVTPGRKRRIIFRWLKVIILIYCSIGIALYYLQEKLLLHPEVLPKNYKFTFAQHFEELNIPINGKDTINMIKFITPAVVRKGLVLYFHGNSQNINHYALYADNFTKMGYDVWMPDYPGFGKSTGELTEKKLYSDAGLIYLLARNTASADSIIIYGKSFGTGIAAQLASEKRCRMLILETPYYSIPALISTYAPIYPTASMSHFKLPTAEYVKRVPVPVIIFHGTDDGVIPYTSSYRLTEVLKATDHFITIKNGNHNNLNNFDLYHKELDSLLK